jgi:SAM-dependent methyltransferase
VIRPARKQKLPVAKPRPNGYVDVDYLAIVARLMRAPKERSYALLELRTGHKVLDLGCGPATDTIALARLVGPAGEVHGADHDAAMIEQANRRARNAGVGAYVRHRKADAVALPWPDGFFDATRSERVFQHLLEPDRAFAELVRVTRPGGRIVILDGDWATFTVESDETAIERRLARFHAEQMIHNPYSGRRLRGLFGSHGLRDVTTEVWPVLVTDYASARRVSRLEDIEREALAAGVIDRNESERWRASLERAEARNGFFCCINGVMTAGRKLDGRR